MTTKSPRQRICRTVAAILAGSCLFVSATDVSAQEAPLDPGPPVVGDAPDAELTPLAPGDVPAALFAVPSSGCTRVDTTTSCELWARSGSVLVDGDTSVNVWVFDDSAADPIELVNPVLEAYAGDTIAITLHNDEEGWIGGPVSLSLPAVQGQPDMAGVAPGPATRLYQFGPLEPGTYLYQAGPTPAGNRQIAMGMAGILIVRPVDYNPADPLFKTAYGGALNAFDDEIIAITNEFDLRLNADPLVFNLADYTPTIFTLNGQSHDGTAAVDELLAESTVLIRSANVGLKQRRLGLPNIRQTQWASNSRLLVPAPDVAGVTLAPGMVADSIAEMPNEMGITVALMDQGLSLFEGSSTLPAGQIELFSLPGVGDPAGPTVSGVGATPEATDGSGPIALQATVTTGGSTPVVRYFIDDLVEGDDGAEITGVTGGPSSYAVQGTITQGEVAALANGEHIVWLQAGENVGTPDEIWGSVGGQVFTIDREGPVVHSIDLTQQLLPDGSVDPAVLAVHATADTTMTGTGSPVQAVRYSIDGVAPLPGDMPTTGSPLGAVPFVSAGPNPARAAAEGTIDVSLLAEGPHTLYLFAQDSFPSPATGHWSQVATPFTFVIDHTAPVVTTAEISPSPNNGTIPFEGSQIFLPAARLSATITDASAIVDAEFSFGPTAADAGTGEPMQSTTATWGDNLVSSVQGVYADLPLADIRSMPEGAVNFWVRGLDEAGNWSAAVAAVLVLDKTAPLITVDPAPAPDAVAFDVVDPLVGAPPVNTSVAAIEWFIGSDPGLGNATQIPVAGPSYVITGQTPGQTMNIRAVDAVGNWSTLVSAVVGA